MTFDIKTEDNVALEDLTAYLNITNDIVNFTNDYFKNENKIALKINLNSPGAINFFGSEKLVLGAAIILALIGCDFEINAFGSKIKVKSPGLIAYIKAYLDYCDKKDNRQKKFEYKKALINLKVIEPEKIKELTETLKKEKNQKD